MCLVCLMVMPPPAVALAGGRGVVPAGGRGKGGVGPVSTGRFPAADRVSRVTAVGMAAAPRFVAPVPLSRRAVRG